MSDDPVSSEEVQLSFKVKTSNEGNHSITMPETATVLDLKTKLAGADYENVPAERQRLIYSGRVMKNDDQLSVYKIKTGNTIHMVKSAQSNAAQNPANSGSTPSVNLAAGVPTNMAAGTANNPLAGLTGARYAGHVQLPGAGMFGPDGGVSSVQMDFQIHS
jgi:ubiquilin